MNARKIARELQAALENGEPALTYEEIVCRVMGVKKATADDVWALRYYLTRARRWLKKDRLYTMLVTDYYFDHFQSHGQEPVERKDAVLSIALHCRSSAGIRVVSMKDKRNDLMCVTFAQLKTDTGAGMMREVLGLIINEVEAGHLTDAKAVKLFRYALAYKQPDQLAIELERFLKAQGITKLESRNGT